MTKLVAFSVLALRFQYCNENRTQLRVKSHHSSVYSFFRFYLQSILYGGESECETTKKAPQLTMKTRPATARTSSGW